MQSISACNEAVCRKTLHKVNRDSGHNPLPKKFSKKLYRIKSTGVGADCMVFILTASTNSAQIATVKTKTVLRRPSALSTVRWTSYAIAAGATGVAGTPTAEAEIHYSGLVNYKFQQESRGSESYSFPLSQGVVLVGYRYVRGAVDNSAGLFLKGAAVSSAFRDVPSYATSIAAALPRGSVISHGPFGFAFGFALGRLQDYACEFPDFLEPGIYSAGFRFNSGAGMQYGWVRIKWGGCSANKFIVRDYAWGDPGDQIKAGQKNLHADETQVAPQSAKSADGVPRADSLGSLGLLALGAVGLQAWRRAR